jgi:hypothetical protein
MNTIKAFTVPHVGENYRSSNDRFFFSIEEGRIYFCISDGAGSSFNPTLWAELITHYKIKESKTSFEEEDIKILQKAWDDKVKEKIASKLFSRNIESLYTIGKEAGATFVRVCFSENQGKKIWKAATMGDSVMLFIPNGQTLPQYVISTNQEQDNHCEYKKIDYIFDTTPDGLLSRSKCNLARQIEIEKPLEKGTFVFMTDALAAWVLSNCLHTEERLKKLLILSSQDEYIQFIASIRDVIDVTDTQSSVLKKLGPNAEIANDDTTLMVVSINDANTLHFSKENIYYMDIETLINEEIEAEIASINPRYNENKARIDEYTQQKNQIEQRARELLISEKLNISDIDSIYATLNDIKQQYNGLYSNKEAYYDAKDLFKKKLNDSSFIIENDINQCTQFSNILIRIQKTEKKLLKDIEENERKYHQYIDVKYGIEDFIKKNPTVLDNLLDIINEYKKMSSLSELQSETEKLQTKIKCLEFQKYNKSKNTQQEEKSSSFFFKIICRIRVLIKKYLKI